MKNSIEFWNKQACKFSVNESNEMKESIEKIYKYIKPNMLVLDFGCGTGVSSRAISKAAEQVIGIDYSDKMIDIAKTSTNDESNIKYLVGTIDDEEVNSVKYDVVLALNVLHLVDDLELTLQKINHILKPSGMLISATPCLGEKNKVTKFLFKLLSKVRLLIQVNPISFAELRESMSKVGFHEIESSELNISDSNIFIVSHKK